MAQADRRLVSVSLLAVVAASGALYVRFKAKNTEFREQTLHNQAGLIADYVKKAPKGQLELPSYITEEFKANNGRYAVVDRDGTVLAASPGITAPLTAVNISEGRLLCPSTGRGPASLLGLSMRTSSGDGPVWVQVAFHAGNIVYDSVLEEFVQDIAWIWIPFVMVLLAVNLLVARIGLAPLRTAAKQAAAIGPAAVSNSAQRKQVATRRACTRQRRQPRSGPTGNRLRRAAPLHRRRCP